jgi:hypothetical protein
LLKSKYDEKKLKNNVYDLDNESGDGINTLCYEDKLDQTKKDRIK